MKLNKALMVAMSSVVGLFANSESTDLIADRPNAYPNPHASQHGDRHNQQQMEQPDQRIHVAFSGDYLYWQPYFSNLPFAQRIPRRGGNATLNSQGVSVQNYSSQNFEVAGDSGFRIGAEYTSDWNNMGLDFEWTSFHTHQTQRREDTSDLTSGELDPGAVTGFLPHFANAWQYQAGRTAAEDTMGSMWNVKSQLKIKFDQFDYKISTFYKPANWAELKFGVGIRNIFSNVSLRNTFLGNKWILANAAGAAGEPASQPPYNTLVERVSQEFNTLGPVVTANAKMDIADGFKFINGFGLSYMVGQLQNRLQTSLTGPNLTIDSGHKNYKTTIKPVYDLDIGLQYEYLNDDKTLGLLLELAYEVHVLPQFVQFSYQERASSSLLRMYSNSIFDMKSDVSVQGLRARAGFSF